MGYRAMSRVLPYLDLSCRDVPDVHFWLSGYPATFQHPILATDLAEKPKTTGYLNQILYLFNTKS